MPLLECRRRRRRQARRRRGATLGPKDTGAVRWAVRCNRRRSCFLHLRRRLPLAPVVVHDSPPCIVHRPVRVRHPLGPLFSCPRLLRNRGEAFGVDVPGEVKFPGRHRGGAVQVEQRQRCVRWLDHGEMVGEWLGRGWMGEKIEGN
jgi:hypothetical protein